MNSLEKKIMARVPEQLKLKHQKVVMTPFGKMENHAYVPEEKTKLPIVGKLQDINNEANKAFRDEVFMPMVKFAVTLIVFTVLIDYTFQLVEAIDWLTLEKL
jgi:hypothetical protein